MIYRSLGAEQERISVIGFGASPLGNVFGHVSTSKDRALIACALEAGINFFDVSPYYGLGLAEERLGAALGPDRTQCFLATKCGRYGVDEFDFSAAGVTRRFEGSLVRLRTDYVDLLQVHDIEFGDIDQIVNETLPALERLKSQGKVRYIGVTGYWPRLLAHMIERHPTDSVLNYCHWNLFVDDMERELSPTCSRVGVSLINASPLHMGLLGSGPVPAWHPAPPAVREAARQVIDLCKGYDVDPATFAIWKCLQHPTVRSTLVGMSSTEQVVSACAALTFVPPDPLLPDVLAAIAGVHNATWPQGRPENEDRKSEELKAQSGSP